MYTIAETNQFKQQVEKLLSEAERLQLFLELANNPLAGDVIPSGGGLRKLRWKRQGMGKHGGVRVIYYNMLENGLILAFAIYAKNEKENISQAELKNLKGKRQ